MTYYITQQGREFIDEAKRTSLFKKGPSVLNPLKDKSLATKYRVMPAGNALSYDRQNLQHGQEGETHDARSDRRITGRGLAANKTSRNPVRSQSRRPFEADTDADSLKPGSLRGDRIHRGDRTRPRNSSSGWGVPGAAGR